MSSKLGEGKRSVTGLRGGGGKIKPLGAHSS